MRDRVMNETIKKRWLIAVVPGILAIAAGAFVITLLLVKLLWAWTTPDMFPGAVDEGLVAREISWFTSLKVAIFAAALAGTAGLRRGRGS